MQKSSAEKILIPTVVASSKKSLKLTANSIQVRTSVYELVSIRYVRTIQSQKNAFLVKYLFDVSQKEKRRRFLKRIGDPMRQWKLSPMNLESYSRWLGYTKAIGQMMSVTDTDYAPWHVVKADDKKRARLNCISHLLSVIPYETPVLPKVKYISERSLLANHVAEIY